MDVKQIYKTLTLIEADKAKKVFNEATAEGVPVFKAALVCYRAGRLEGQKEAESKLKKKDAYIFYRYHQIKDSDEYKAFKRGEYANHIKGDTPRANEREDTND